MLLKIIGAVMLIAGGGGLGMYYGADSGFRKRELEQLKRALMLIYSETEFGHTCLAPMSKKASRVCDGATGSIFTDFSQALTERTTESITEMWKSCVKQNIKNTHLSAEDIEAIENLGSSLGVGDINRQLTAVKGLMGYIDCRCQELEETGRRNMKLYKSTGVLLGAFVVILLF